MTRGRFAALVVTTVLCLSVSACAWDDTTESRDMPWLGRGGRARWFYKRSECFMCPTGYTSENRWGSSAWSGHEPYGTVQAAFRFLMKAKGFRETWPEAHGEGSVGGADTDVIDPLLTGVAITRVPFGRSNYGAILSVSTNGTVGLGISLMNISLLPVLP